MWKQALWKGSYRYKELLLCHSEYTADTIHISTSEEIKNKIIYHIPCQPPSPPTYKFSIVFYCPDTILEAAYLKMIWTQLLILPRMCWVLSTPGRERLKGISSSQWESAKQLLLARLEPWRKSWAVFSWVWETSGKNLTFYHYVFHRGWVLPTGGGDSGESSLAK